MIRYINAKTVNDDALRLFMPLILTWIEIDSPLYSDYQVNSSFISSRALT